MSKIDRDFDSALSQALNNCNDLNDNLRNTIADLNSRFDEIEKKSNRPDFGEGLSANGGKSTQSYKAFGKLLRFGADRLDPSDRQAAVISSDDSKGGYLAPADFIEEVLKVIPDFSPIRKLAYLGNTASGEILIPKRTATGTAFWVGDNELRSEVIPTYGQERLMVNEAGGFVDASVQTLEDSAIDVAAEIAQGLGEEFGRLEGRAALLGSGPKEPEGLLTNANIVSIPSGHASTITADALITMLYSLPAYYRNRSTWICSAATVAAIRKLKDGNGQYILQPGLAQDRPDTLLSRPLVEAADAPDMAANATPLILGAWKEGYRIYDRVYLSILRDNFTQALTGKVRFWARRRVAMGVVLPEAFRKMKISTS